eukprot:CAMPEP_0198152844 /NCGR_PEP_ID=MMETSP1443-20131203/61510_1 /TAXON_ID=186043 /ORGANISM="Entomoneis sp., Strain CCMP2396" /LENGTH=379 /DNA_ID=CAMNT_0043818977 /DNA_START=141 /DNA_END=1280 /DNA_ORIENTATION=+
MKKVLFVVFALVAPLRIREGNGFTPAFTNSKKQNSITSSLEYVSPDMTGLTEAALLDTASRMQLLPVDVASTIHKEEKVNISFVHWAADKEQKKSDVPLILVHGFDSSCLEYRRLGSRLADEGVDTYAVDLLGWGFTQLDGVETFSADAKVAALNAFIDKVAAGGKFCIAGASLGGASAIEVAATNPNCAALLLIDAQGFVDGIGPMSMMPKPVAKLGVEVLKSVPLRSSANQMSYFDKETYATDEAVVVGRLHCLREGWSDALVSFMQSGGFSPSTKLAKLTCPSLVLWGRQDGILDGKEFAPKFLEAISDAELRWIEECGHVPHLEQPEETVNAITSFLAKRVFTEDLKKEAGIGWLGPSLGIAGVSASVAVVATQF